MPKQKRSVREVDPSWKHKFEQSVLFKPTWKQRLKIALGYSLYINAVAFSRNSPGRVAAGIFCRTTRITNSQDPRLALLAKAESEKAQFVNLPSQEQCEAAENRKDQT